MEKAAGRRVRAFLGRPKGVLGGIEIPKREGERGVAARHGPASQLGTPSVWFWSVRQSLLFIRGS